MTCDKHHHRIAKRQERGQWIVTVRVRFLPIHDGVPLLASDLFVLLNLRGISYVHICMYSYRVVLRVVFFSSMIVVPGHLFVGFADESRYIILIKLIVRSELWPHQHEILSYSHQQAKYRTVRGILSIMQKQRAKRLWRQDRSRH